MKDIKNKKQKKKEKKKKKKKKKERKTGRKKEEKKSKKNKKKRRKEKQSIKPDHELNDRATCFRPKASTVPLHQYSWQQKTNNSFAPKHFFFPGTSKNDKNPRVKNESVA